MEYNKTDYLQRQKVTKKCGMLHTAQTHEGTGCISNAKTVPEKTNGRIRGIAGLVGRA